MLFKSDITVGKMISLDGKLGERLKNNDSIVSNLVATVLPSVGSDGTIDEIFNKANEAGSEHTEVSKECAKGIADLLLNAYKSVKTVAIESLRTSVKNFSPAFNTENIRSELTKDVEFTFEVANHPFFSSHLFPKGPLTTSLDFEKTSLNFFNGLRLEEPSEEDFELIDVDDSKFPYFKSSDEHYISKREALEKVFDLNWWIRTFFTDRSGPPVIDFTKVTYKNTSEIVSVYIVLSKLKHSKGIPSFVKGISLDDYLMLVSVLWEGLNVYLPKIKAFYSNIKVDDIKIVRDTLEVIENKESQMKRVVGSVHIVTHEYNFEQDRIIDYVLYNQKGGSTSFSGFNDDESVLNVLASQNKEVVSKGAGKIVEAILGQTTKLILSKAVETNPNLSIEVLGEKVNDKLSSNPFFLTRISKSAGDKIVEMLSFQTDSCGEGEASSNDPHRGEENIVMGVMISECGEFIASVLDGVGYVESARLLKCMDKATKDVTFDEEKVTKTKVTATAFVYYITELATEEVRG